MSVHQSGSGEAQIDLTRFARIPSALTKRHRWMLWEWGERDGKRTKIPCSATTGRWASVKEPGNWSTYRHALAKYAAGGFDGIGFAFSSDDILVGVDLDNALTEAGELEPWAREIVAHFPTYTEVSPRGGGLKLICEGTLPEDGKKLPPNIELYHGRRFFAITGNVFAGSPVQVTDCSDAALDLYRRIILSRAKPPRKTTKPPPAPVTAEDTDIIEKLTRTAKSAQLWNGDDAGFGSASEADLSLLNQIAFYVGPDPARIQSIFNQSGRSGRDKWAEREDYRQRSVEKSLEGRTEFYDWSRRNGGGNGHGAGQRRASSTPRAATEGIAEEQEQSADDPAVAVDPEPPQAEGDPDGLVALGDRDPSTGRLVLSPKKTLPTAESFVRQFHWYHGDRTLQSYAGTMLAWAGNRFAEVEEESVKQRLQPWLHKALRYHCNQRTGEMTLIDFESNPSTINASLESIKTFTHLPVSVTPPCWLGGTRGKPEPRNLLPFPSGTLDLTTGATIPPTPALFNINAIDFDYDPRAARPENWLAFLLQLWPNDPQSIELLQEWFGYCLTGDTSQHKMLLMVGPKRSGKGTIGRVMTRLVGSGNVVGPTTSSLAGTFGLQPLLGKSLAIVSDARFSGENIGVVIERLLCISGEDLLTVDRKFLGGVTMKLPTRLVFLTNELPRMNDASGALAGRFVILRLTKSFFGVEDTGLTPRLMGELPGILLWAIEGLKRLRQRGHFVQPESVADAVQEMEDLASPVLAFVRDCCEVGPEHRTWIDDMYQAWKRWCEGDGRVVVTNRQTFGRDLAAAVPGVICRRHRIQGRFYDGIAIRGDQ